MHRVKADPMSMASLAVLREIDIAITPRVAAANFDVVNEQEAKSQLEKLELLGYVERIGDDLYELK